ncbi:MAG: T9SS type A sorting domain-containing protein [Candidatus Zixiibacteriota bacterium]
MRRFANIIVLISLFVGSGSGASIRLATYEARHDDRRISAQQSPLTLPQHNASGQTYSKSSLFEDVQLNSDSEPETFRQQFADVAVLPDGKFVVIWEDDRNGDLDIFAQVYSDDNVPIGGNTRLIYDETFADQRMPSCDAFASGNIVVAWIDKDGSLYGRVFDQDLIPVTPMFKVNDNTGQNICNLPRVSYLYGGSIAFVWEDSRNGENIFCQIYTPIFEPLGSNFQVNTSATNSKYWSPDIANGVDEGFAISWEEITSLGSSVVMKTYTTGGVPISGLISLPDPAHGSDDQFQSSVCHLDGIGYTAFWIDTRNSNQVVYGQIITYAGSKNGANLLVSDNPDYVCWDISCAKSGDNSILATWASYGERAEILATRFDASGDRIGSNVTVSDPALFQERFYPKVAIGGDDLPAVVWTDLRNGEIDTYFQRLDATGGLDGVNELLETVTSGAQQLIPDIALLDGNEFASVWHDCRSDDGDIYIQFGNAAGIPTGSNQKVNEDIHTFLQTDPSIGSDGGMHATVAWLDAREASGMASGLKVYARRYGSSGTPLTNELQLNDDASSATKANPDAAQASTGRASVVWEDGRNGQRDIYCQRISSLGALDGVNFKVNSEPALIDNFSPKVGMSGSNDIVIAWKSVVADVGQVYLQVISASGVPVGGNVPVAYGRAGDSQEDFDLAVGPASGEFVIAWISKSQSDEYAILAQRYSAAAVPVGDAVSITSSPALALSEISTAIDAAGNFTVCWTDARSGHPSVYMAVVTSDDIVGSATPVAHPGVEARAEHCALAMTGHDVFAVWSDNRNAGNGFDIYANSYDYSPTAADDLDQPIVPAGYKLSQNYPNPFNPITTIGFYLAKSGAASIQVHNLLGQLVAREEWEHLGAGWHSYEFVGADIPSGVYFYRLTAGDFNTSKKMLLLK